MSKHRDDHNDGNFAIGSKAVHNCAPVMVVDFDEERVEYVIYNPEKGERLFRARPEELRRPYPAEELAARIVASWLPEAWLVYWTFNGYSTYISKYGDNRWRWSAGHADGFDDNGYEGSLSEAAMAIAKIVTGEAGLEDSNATGD